MMWVSCSWCHQMNPTDRRYCAHCGHEVGVPRLECRCAQCEVSRARFAAYERRQAQAGNDPSESEASA